MLEDTLQKIENKKYQSDKNNSDEIKISKDKITSIAVLSALIIIICFLSLYSIAYRAGMQDNKNSLQYPSSGMASEQPVAECILYSDQIIITSQECSVPVDCAPNGICLTDYGVCAYFIN